MDFLPDLSIQMFEESVAAIERHLTLPVSAEEISGSVGYSRFHFDRLFLSQTGITPARYLRKRRLAEAARALVNSSARILDIALAYQFRSQESFTRSFQKEFGLSPGAYRKRNHFHRPFPMLRSRPFHLLYAGKGIHPVGKIIVPTSTIVEAVNLPHTAECRDGEVLTQMMLMTKQPLSIRSAERQDIPHLCRLYFELHESVAQCVPNRLRSLGDPEAFDASWLSNKLDKLLDAVDVIIFVAEVSDKIVGLAEVYLRKDDAATSEQLAYQYGYLQSLLVGANFRGRGIGERLLKAAEQWARERGASELRLETWEYNGGPLGFYQQQGYRTLKRTLVRSL